MKLGPLFNLAVLNGAALVMAALVYDDRVWRVAYWQSLGFTPTTSYFPLFYITSAVGDGTSIRGVLTVDWLQVIILVALVVDAAALVGIVRRRNRQEQVTPPPAGTLQG